MKKILIVDDEQEIVELVRLRLEANGYKVVSAKDGLEGINQAKLERPDLILMDIMMPNLTGGDAVRRLKDLPETSDIPVIFFTGVVSKIPRNQEGRSVNINGHFYPAVAKPFEPEELISEIRKYLA